MHNYWKNNCVKFHPHPIWNNNILAFFEAVAPQEQERQNE